MRKRSIAVALLMVVASAAVAEPPRYADWFEGPVKHLMTDEEATRFQSIQSQQEAESFMALFWAKRDPTSNTAPNEFRDEFDKRVALADEHFTTKRTRGAMTDRGRALILLGSPFQVGTKGAEARAVGMAAGTGQLVGPRGESAMLTWTYAYDKKPKFIKRKDLEILFVDDAGDGQWQFAATARTNPEAVLRQAVLALILSPRLTKAPVLEVATAAPALPLTFRNISLKAAYDQFKSEQKPALGSAYLTWGEFVTPEGEGFVPVSIYVPAGAGIEAGRKVTFFGVVENAAGEVVEIHEEEATLTASGKDAYVDKSLSLAPGKYVATFGLAADGNPVAINKTEMTITGLDAKEPAVSDMILSNNAYPLPQAQHMTDPFAFGGLKVVPKGDAQFATSDDIWYFVEMRNPGMTGPGAPTVQVKIDINGKTDKEKPVKLNFPVQGIETIPLKGVKDHYALAMSFPLKDFAPGNYTVKIKVIDTVLQKTYNFERHFDIKL